MIYPSRNGRGIQKSIFLKSGQLITGLSKAWIGTTTKALELPASSDEESYQYTLLTTKSFTLHGQEQASTGITAGGPAALLPSLTADDYMALKQLKVEITHDEFTYGAYSKNDSPNGAWQVAMFYGYAYNVPSSGISKTFIYIPIFQQNVKFTSDTITKVIPATNYGKAYAPPHYSGDYKTLTDIYSEYERNPNVTVNYDMQYSNRAFFNNLRYPYMTYQYCNEHVKLIASGGSFYSYHGDSSSQIWLPNNVNVTVKIYGAY